MPGVQFSPRSGGDGGMDTGGHPPHRSAGSHQSLLSRHLFQASHSHIQSSNPSLEEQKAPAESNRWRFRCERCGSSCTSSSSHFSINQCVSSILSCSVYFTDGHTCTHSHAGVVTLAHWDTPPFFLLSLGTHDYTDTSSWIMRESSAIFMREAGAEEGTVEEGGVCETRSAGSLKLRHSYTISSFVWAAPVRSVGRADCAQMVHQHKRVSKGDNYLPLWAAHWVFYLLHELRMGCHVVYVFDGNKESGWLKRDQAVQ